MNINGTNIMFTEEDRLLLRTFFENNIEFINTHNLLRYENIKIFGDLYEQFIDENNLRDNDILMLFLAEIRISQLSYKITANTIKIRVLSNHNINANDTIIKWYKESKIFKYITSTNIQEANKGLTQKLKQNEEERKKSWKDAAKKYVK